MSHKLTQLRAPAPRQRGFTLVELMITVGIAVFLLFGLLKIVENLRTASINQNAITQLQDEQRFAMTVLTDAIQAGGFYSNPTTDSTASFPSAPNSAPTAAFLAGAAFAGSHAPGVADNLAQDSIATRFITNTGYGPVLCNGTDTSLELNPTNYTVQFTVATNPAGSQLLCSVNGGAAIPLVTGVTAMAIYYGVNRSAPNVNYNVDTYVTWDMMNAQDFFTVSSVRVVLTFANPLFPQADQPATITMERVIEVMGRAGDHT